VNVLGTRNLLESCLSGNIKRIVHLSSTGSIGPSKTKGLLLTEDTSPSPINAYGRSKYRAEKVVLQYVEKNKLPITIIRAPVIYGPHQPPVVTRIFQQVTKGKFPVIGDGTALRSLCYIDNLIEGIFLAETNNTIGETYNIADEEVLSIRQIASTIANELGIDLAFTRLPTWVKRLSGFSMRFLDLFGMSSMQLYSVYSIAVDLGCDVSKARATLGYKSKVGFKDGIKHTIQWCKNNGLIN
jgi:UDP-glucose 4-epimerase